MKNNNFFNNIKHIHFIGIGGISVSALAKLMLNKGKKVTGSDLLKTKITQELTHLGVEIFYSHKKNNIKGAELIVYTGAVKESNEELIEGKKLNIKCLERSEFLGLVAKEYKNIISVAGSHGKTTTCGMMASVFVEADVRPTVHMGGLADIIGGNLLIGDKEFFITEACEYKNSFLKTKQTVGVILNIENDHTDYFKNLKDIYNSFTKFFENSKDNNVIHEKYLGAIKKNNNNYITFSLSGNADYLAKNIKLTKSAHITFTVYFRGKNLGRFEIRSPLRHNVYNALATIAVARIFDIDVKTIKRGLKKFSGIKRRFEIVKKINDAVVIHDYAHHPTEIKSTINCCYELFKKPIICVFQPHTFSRTKSLMVEFLKSFEKCSKVIIAKTYAAREKPLKGGTGKDLCKNLKIAGVSAIYLNSFKKIKKYLYKNASKNQIILILGAGDIEELAYDII